MNSINKTINSISNEKQAKIRNNLITGDNIEFDFYSQQFRGTKSEEKGNNNQTITASPTRRMEQTMTRICTRAIKFRKINRSVLIGDNSGEGTVPSIYLDSIEFTEGLPGKIDYSGCNSNKPDLSQEDFSIKIPCRVSSFIVRVSVCSGESYLKAHWLIDLKIRSAIALSVVKNGTNPGIECCFQNSSACVIASNTHIMPRIKTNSSNLRHTLSDKDTVVSPYQICLFSANLC